MPESCVYLIGTPGNSVVKIGRTIHLARRLAVIQAMSPVPLEVLWSSPGGSALEAALHRHFADQRLHGEWFQFSGDPVEAVVAAVESEPWARRSPPDNLTPQEEAAWLCSLARASEAHRQARAELEELIAEARLAGVPLTAIEAHSPFSREWARRIAHRVAASKTTSA